MTKAEAIEMLKRIQEPEAWEPQINQAVCNFYNSKLNEKRGMAMSEYKLVRFL